MRLPSLLTRHHLGAAVIGAVVIGAAIAPAAALADAEHESREGTAVDPDDTDTSVVGCSDPLSVISWNGADDAGDPLAVAITAQLLDADTEGWSSASWQAAAGTTLTAVTATRVEGGLAALAPEPTGTADEIVALTFCGTAETGPDVPSESADRESADDPPPAPMTVATCEDLLTVVTPDRVEGNPLAVAITAQALDLGEPGWSNVGWEAAAGTRLRAVLVTGTDGTVNEAGAATSATDVASLSFCGIIERSTSEVPPTSPPTSVVPPTTPAGPTASTSGGPSETTHAAVREPSVVASEADLTIVTVGTPEAPDEDVAHTAGSGATEPDDTGTDDTGTDDTGTDETENDETEEVEVLGIQLTRENQPSGGGPLGTGVALIGVLALLATAGGVLWSRHS